jgi:alpha-ribazole phosphatase/probable phosphoglycerate mutase
MTRLWLIRHGEPAPEGSGRCYGSSDIGLSERGRAQMAIVRTRLASEGITVICASPLARAVESARILADALHCPIQIEPGFREIDFGAFEGLTYDEIKAQYPALYSQWMEAPTTVKFPSGESFHDLQVRVLEAFESIRRARCGETVAFVTHGGVNRVLLAWALQIPDSAVFRLAQDYAGMNLLTFPEGTPVVHLVNYCEGAGPI